jgi:hypothetical protein
MEIKVQDETSKVSRRELLAHIALADLPIPRHIQFYGLPDDEQVGLFLDTLDEGRAWAAATGASQGEVHEYSQGDHHRRWLSMGPGVWHGWAVALTAHEDVPAVEALAEGTRAALGELVQA